MSGGSGNSGAGKAGVDVGKNVRLSVASPADDIMFITDERLRGSEDAASSMVEEKALAVRSALAAAVSCIDESLRPTPSSAEERIGRTNPC